MLDNDSSKAVKRPLNEELELSWRDLRYHTFYEVVDQLVYEIQEHVWRKTGKTKRRLRAVALEKLHYSVECLVRDCVAVVFQRKRILKEVFLGQQQMPDWLSDSVTLQ